MMRTLSRLMAIFMYGMAQHGLTLVKLLALPVRKDQRV
jgi:hypothetical protein